MKCFSLFTIFSCASFAVLAPAAAQAVAGGNGLAIRHVQVEGATTTSLALALPVGWKHDPAGRTGCAEAMRWCLTFAQRRQPVGARFAVAVRPDLTMLSHSGPSRDVGARLDFLAGLLAGELEISADLHALALGRARLEADNHSVDYPGSIIRQKAWRALFSGQALGRQHLGIAAEIGELSRDELAARYRAHYGCMGASLVVVGAVDATSWQRTSERLLGITRLTKAPATTVHDSAPRLEVTSVHERVGGPYVTAAIPALSPGHADYLPFVAAMLVLRSAAYRDFDHLRGKELDALFRFVDYPYWDGAPMVRINRRGLDGSAPAAPRTEICDMLSRLRRRGATQGQLEAVRVEIAHTLRTPPFGNKAAPFLAVRARHLATALCLQWPLDLADGVGRLALADLNRVLREHLAADRPQWFVLEPRPGDSRRRLWQNTAPTRSDRRELRRPFGGRHND